MKKSLSLLLAIILASLVFVPSAFALTGDANDDTKVTIHDAVAIQRHLASLEPLTNTGGKFADANGDGIITLLDVISIQMYCAELIKVFPADEKTSDTDSATDTSSDKASDTDTSSDSATDTSSDISTDTSSDSTTDTSSDKASDTDTATDTNTDTNTDTDTSTDTNTDTSTDYISYIDSFIADVNAARREKNLPNYSKDVRLCSAAKVRSSEIITSFSNARPDGREGYTCLIDAGMTAGIDFTDFYEYVTTSNGKIEDTFNYILNVEKFKPLLYSETYEKIGVGVTKKDNMFYISIVFIAKEATN